MTEKPCEASVPERPWLKSYPEGVAWDARFRPTLVGSLLDQSVQAFGPRPCVYFMGKRLSFAEIGALSDRVAKGLRALGVGEGVKVGLLLPNTPTFVIFYYGVLKAGGTVVNFNPLYSLEEIEFQIRDSGTKIMVTLDLAVTFDKVEAMLDKRRARQGRGRELRLAAAVLEIGRLQDAATHQARQVSASAAADKIVRERDLCWPMTAAMTGPRSRPTPSRCCNIPAAPPARPKGAMLSHANLTINRRSGQQRGRTGQTTEDDRMLGVLPLFHVFAMTTVMNFGIASGMEMILLPKFELIETLKLIAKLRPTMMPGVPTLFNAMLRHPHIRNFDLSSLEYCISGGAALPIEVKRGFEAMSGCGVVEGYGLSETSPVATCNPIEAVEGRLDRPAAARHRDLASARSRIRLRRCRAASRARSASPGRR